MHWAFFFQKVFIYDILHRLLSLAAKRYAERWYSANKTRLESWKIHIFVLKL